MSNAQPELSFRAWANHQRRCRESFLESASITVAARLAGAKCVYSPEAHTLVDNLVQTAKKATAVTYTGRHERALSLASAGHGAEEFSPAYLLIGDLDEISLAGEKYLVPKRPIFTVPFGAARRLLLELWEPSSGMAAAWTTRQSSGILVDGFGEHCREDPGPNGFTYKVVSWSGHPALVA